MKILVIGSGGREHAIVDALSRNPAVRKLYAAPGNGGIASLAELVPIASDNVRGLADFAKQQNIDLTFVGPEVPLSLGVVDLLQRSGLKVVGPTAQNAQLESSKAFAKNFMRDAGIPTASFHQCGTVAEAQAVLDESRYPVVIKADGLAAGKGVVIAETPEQARSTVRDFMEKRTMGDAGTKLVLEECLRGEEASFLVFADGTAYQPMALSQDHKRRFDGDRGPNTGGMGAFSTDTILTPQQHETVLRTIIEPALQAARTYSGILYAGLMMTADGPKVIEFNARFGDPETQVILPRMKTDLLDVLVDISEHRLASRKIEWSPEVSATVVLVAGGYPGPVQNGKIITGLERAAVLPGVRLYHAGTALEDGSVYTSGGRVLNVTATGTTLGQALDRAYAAAEVINFEGKDFRRDIGRKGLATRL
jgi:phosphoribosylamine--glycine ligase